MTAQEARILELHEAFEPDARQKIAAILAEGSVTQAQICRESGVSSGILSPWLQEKYRGDSQAVEAKLRTWLNARERKTQIASVLPVAPPWIETPTAEKITAVLAYAQMAGDVGCIYGGAGMGKTVTLRAYAENNPNVWVVEMHAAGAAVASALEEIAEAVGLRGLPSRAVRLHREIVKRLRGSEGLLIIDEAQHLRTGAIEAIRALHDATGVGLVLCGNESVYARLTGGSREATFAQLFSRLGKRLHLAKPNRADVLHLAAHYGVTDKAEQALLMEIAAKPGALRGVVKALRLAGMFAAGAGATAIGCEHIRAAWVDLGGAA
ncbi:AAA family ATPase [Geoalkalibacter halelectricus]|uniref:AAA family ATPase n=1 Tax=Geoalkalibacter halelectricus TaxID=2847045 RepID=UPI003D1AB8A4